MNIKISSKFAYLTLSLILCLAINVTAQNRTEKNTEDDLITGGSTRLIRGGNASGSAGNPVAVNILVDAVGDESEYQFTVNFDTNVLTYQSATPGTISAGSTLCNIPMMMPGVLICTIGSFPDMGGGSNNLIGEIAAGNNQLMATLNFVVSGVAVPGSRTVLAISNTQASNDATMALTVMGQDGSVSLAPLTAALASVGGRILNQSGRGVTGAVIQMTDVNGEIRSARTNSFGYYRFDDVEVGEEYIFSIFAKRYRFTPQILQISETLTEQNFTVQ